MAVVAAGAAAAIILLTEGPSPRRPPTATPPSTASTAPPTPAAPPAPQLGANTGRLFNGGVYSRSQIDAQLAALEQTGATVARSDALWEPTEPTAPVNGAHRYDWSFDDTIADALAAHRLRWLPIIDYSPPWARSIPGQDHSPPTSPQDYAAYAAALAARYGPGGAFWKEHPELSPLPVDTYEIWNEPDNPAFWRPAPDPARYDTLYASARAAIAAVQPAARVIVGGLTNPGAFLPGMLAADPGLRSELGGVAIHPYAPQPEGTLAKVRADRRLLISLGLGGLPLYVTEIGWTTSPAGALDWAPAAARPAYIYRTITALARSGCGLAAILLYAWFTPRRDPSDPQDWFGIDALDAAGGPDVSAFAAALRAVAAGGPSSSCS